MEDEMMATIDKLRNEVAATKEDMLSGMEPVAMEPYIWNLLTDYYYSYVNDNMDKFHAVDKNLDATLTAAYHKTNNAANYINYCKISILTGLLNKLFKRDVSLELPDTVAIHESNNKTKEQRDNEYDKEFKDMLSSTLKEIREDDDAYFKQLEVDMMNNGDYVKHLIRPDVDVEYVEDHLETIRNILSDEGMAALNHYINER